MGLLVCYELLGTLPACKLGGARDDDAYCVEESGLVYEVSL